MKVGFFWFFSFLLVMLFFFVFVLVKTEKAIAKGLNSQFECGFSLMNPSQLPFSFQFYLVALLFLIFDVEIALILSYPMEPWSLKALYVIFWFLLILMVGLLYEWQKSKIDWSK